MVAVDKWMEDLICGNLAKETSREVLGEILQLCWAIWKARNNYVFNSQPLNPEEVIDQASRANKDYLLAVCTKHNNSAPPRQVEVMKWEPPPSSFIKINTDGAFTSSRSLAAFGIIARDSGGSAQWWRSGKVLVDSALSIEAWALRIACSAAVEDNLECVIFESDCKNLVSYVVNDQAECPWAISAIVEDIKSWAKNREWIFKWCRRATNSAAHWIATNSKSRSLHCFTGCIPPDLETILSRDLS